MSFTDIYDRLELTGKDGFISLASPDWCADVQLPERILRLIQDTSCPLSQLSALFCFGGKPLLFFFDNPLNDSLLHKAIWNLNEIPVVIVQKENTVDVYNGFAFEKDLNSLKKTVTIMLRFLMAFATAFTVATIAAPELIMRIYTPDEEIIAYGAIYLRWMIPTY